MVSFLVFLALLGTAIYFLRSPSRTAARTSRDRELAALRALVDRIDRLADDGRDIRTDPQANAFLSVQVLDEIRAHRRRDDADHFGLPAAERSTPLSKINKKQRDRLARQIGRPR